MFDQKMDLKPLAPKNPGPKIRVLILNVASLPPILKMNFNNKRLASAKTRAQLIVEEILKKDIDVLCLQEAWDPEIADYLIKMLKPKFPCHVRGIGKDITHPINLVRSGMLTFSRFPILEIRSELFSNAMVGEEWVGQKGFTAIKILLDPKTFGTVYHTHLHAGGGLWVKMSAVYGGSTAERRAEQMKQIRIHVEKFAHLPPGESKMKHQVTLICGDFNTCINDEARMLSVCTTTLPNRVIHEIKRLEQYRFFKMLELTIPKNYMDIRRDQPNQISRIEVDELKKVAVKLNKATCSLKEISAGLQSGGKLIDGIFVCKDEKEFGEFTSEIMQLSGEIELSDHLCVYGVYEPNNRKIKNESQYEADFITEKVAENHQNTGVKMFCSRRSVRYVLLPKKEIAKELVP